VSLFDLFGVSSKPQSGRCMIFVPWVLVFQLWCPVAHRVCWCGAPENAPKDIPDTIQEQELQQIPNSTEISAPRAFKSSGFWRLWRTVSNLCGRFLENDKYAIRSCLCCPNSFPSTPDTSQSEPKSHPRNTKTTNSVACRCRLLFYFKSGPQKPARNSAPRNFLHSGALCLSRCGCINSLLPFSVSLALPVGMCAPLPEQACIKRSKPQSSRALKVTGARAGAAFL